MIIYDKTGKQILDVPVDDTSYRYRSIMGQYTVTLQYSLTEHVELPVGSYINYQGARYTLWLPQDFTKEGTRNFEYKVEFGSDQEILKKYKYKNTSARPYKLKFSLTAKPLMFIQLLVDNLNLYDSGWTVGKCIEATEKVISFNHEYCSSVLSKLAEEFSTEFEIVGKTIHFCKVEKFKDSPLPLSYGKGNGFKTGVGRANEGDKAPITVLYVQGGDRNIDFSTYKSDTLLLPKLQELTYEGRRYKTDEYGMSITRAEKAPTNIEEDGYDASNIYPMREGTVTKVETETGKDTDGNPVTFYNIIDVTIPEALNFRDCRIPGEKATIIFQTGKLTGREFDIMQTDKDLTGYIHATRCFKLVSLTEGKMTLPNETLCPEIGDKYAVFHISLPDAYVCNNVDKTGASWDMFREAARYFYEHEDDRFTFSGELDGMWAKKRWLEIGGKIVPGGYVQFSDDQFQPDGVLIRITGVKDYINKPHSPSIELSNSPVAVPISNDLGKPDANEVTTDNQHKEGLRYTERRWRDAKELSNALENSLLNFSAGINPVSVRAMQILLGDESLQFRFVNNKTNPEAVDHPFNYNDETKVFSTGTGIIQHLTLGINTMSPAHKPNEYKYWNMQAYTSPALDTSPEAMWLYAKCSKTGATGTFVFSKDAIKMDKDASYFHFLTGYLNSEFDGKRSFAPLYGYTEITPGQMRVNKIISEDGSQYWDMLSRAFKIGNDNSFFGYNIDGSEQLIQKGIFVQSPSGTISPLPVYVGQYNGKTVYYPGDEVLYNGSTYRCIKQISNVYPTNITYWHVIALKGTDGTNGRNGYDGTDGRDGKDGKDGLNGTNGIPGALPTQRKWVNGTTYYRNNDTVDYIMYQSSEGAVPTWWRLRKGYTSVEAGNSPSTTYFEQISSFEAIATMVLLANEANLANFIFKEGMLVSQAMTAGVRNLILNGETGEITARKGTFIGSIGTPFRTISPANNSVISMTDGFNLALSTMFTEPLTIKLPWDGKNNGVRCNIFNSGITKSSGNIKVRQNSGYSFLGCNLTSKNITEISIPLGGVAEFICIVLSNGSVYWCCLNYNDLLEK